MRKECACLSIFRIHCLSCKSNIHLLGSHTEPWRRPRDHLPYRMCSVPPPEKDSQITQELVDENHIRLTSSSKQRGIENGCF